LIEKQTFISDVNYRFFKNAEKNIALSTKICNIAV